MEGQEWGARPRLAAALAPTPRPTRTLRGDAPVVWSEGAPSAPLVR
jgi:hypothetical protein